DAQRSAAQAVQIVHPRLDDLVIRASQIALHLADGQNQRPHASHRPIARRNLRPAILRPSGRPFTDRPAHPHHTHRCHRQPSRRPHTRSTHIVCPSKEVTLHPFANCSPASAPLLLK